MHAPRVDQGRRIVETLGTLDLVPGRMIATGDLELTESLVLAGVGVGILPRRVAGYGDGRELVVLDPSLPQIPTAWCSAGAPTPIAPPPGVG